MRRLWSCGFWVLLVTCAVVDLVFNCPFPYPLCLYFYPLYLRALVLSHVALLGGFLLMLAGVCHRLLRPGLHRRLPRLRPGSLAILTVVAALLLWLNLRPRWEYFPQRDGSINKEESVGWPYPFGLYSYNSVQHGEENLSLGKLSVYLDVAHGLLILIGAPLIWERLLLRRKRAEGNSQ